MSNVAVDLECACGGKFAQNLNIDGGTLSDIVQLSQLNTVETRYWLKMHRGHTAKDAPPEKSPMGFATYAVSNKVLTGEDDGWEDEDDD